MISKTLKTSIKFCSPDLVFESKDFSAQYLRSLGEMVILCAGVDSNIINLIDDMLRYLHVQVEPVMMNLLSLMISHGTYYFVTHQ